MTYFPKPEELKVKEGRPLEYTEARIKELADGLLVFMSEPKNFWLKDYAIELGVPAEELSRLAERSTYFSQALKQAKDIQESKLAKNGLQGRFNAQMTKFALTNVAGWREQGSIDLTSGGHQLSYIALPSTIDATDAEVIDEDVAQPSLYEQGESDLGRTQSTSDDTT